MKEIKCMGTIHKCKPAIIDDKSRVNVKEKDISKLTGISESELRDMYLECGGVEQVDGIWFNSEKDCQKAVVKLKFRIKVGG